jgi:hypothetical protein
VTGHPLLKIVRNRPAPDTPPAGGCPEQSGSGLDLVENPPINLNPPVVFNDFITTPPIRHSRIPFSPRTNNTKSWLVYSDPWQNSGEHRSNFERGAKKGRDKDWRIATQTSQPKKDRSVIYHSLNWNGAVKTITDRYCSTARARF